MMSACSGMLLFNHGVPSLQYFSPNFGGMPPALAMEAATRTFDRETLSMNCSVASRPARSTRWASSGWWTLPQV